MFRNMSLEKNSDAWLLVQFYVDCHNVDANHIRAYDEFIERAKRMLETKIEAGNAEVKLTNLHLVAPYHIVEGKKVDIYPSECVRYKETYCSDMFCDIEYTVQNAETEEYDVSDTEMVSELVKYLLPNIKTQKIQKEIVNIIDGWENMGSSEHKRILKVIKPHIDVDEYVCGDEYCGCADDRYFHVLERIEKRSIKIGKSRKRSVTVNDKEKQIFEHVHIGTIPVMVGSCLCNLRNGSPSKEVLKDEFVYGLGGYFVYKGTSRFIMPQERSTFNRFMCFDDEATKSKNKKFLKSVTIRNSATDHAPTSLMTLGYQKNGYFYINMKYLHEKKYIPAVHFFHAIGFTDPESIIEQIIDKDDPFFPTAAPYLLRLLEHGDTSSYLEEIGCLGKDKVNDKEVHVQNVIDRHFLHHYRDVKSKARYYGFMILTLVRFIEGHLRPEDRDHFGKKVLDTEATLFSNVFYTSMRKTIAEITSNLEKSAGKTINAKILFPYKDPSKMPVTSGFVKALTINNWGGTEKKDGVSQVFDPHNYAGAIINLARCTLQLSKQNKKKKPRMVHGSMYGVVDFFDTPEGENVGYNKVMAALAYISNTIDISNVIEYISNNCLPVNCIDDADSGGDHPVIPPINDRKKIFVDNHWVGVTTRDRALKIVKKLRKCKKNGKIEATVSIVWNDIREEVHIYSQCGRLMRPWLVVENGDLVYSGEVESWRNWEDALCSGAFEMLDQNELEFSMIATSITEFYELSEKERLECQYCDIHPATLLGAGAGCITDPSRNQGPRNAYGANMKRQAIGTTGRFDSPRSLYYPQRTLVENRLANVLLKYDQYSAGMNVPIAFCPYKGMTIEDGSVVSKSAIEMGLFWTDKVTTKEIEITDPENELIEVPIPDECFRYKSYRNHNLDENGLIKVGSLVRENDVLCGKTILIDNEMKPKMDQSLLYRETNRAYVKNVNVIEKGWRGCKIVKIDLVEIKIPEWGNKITPLCAQKTTIAEIAAREDMPFCPYPNEAPNPVVIYSPLCLPSRMTISLLYEVFLGGYVASMDYHRVRRGKKGKYYHDGAEDCTQFEGNDEEKLKWIMNRLKEMGYRSDGCLQLYNGMNGRMIKTQIFTGIVHMQVLKHMVSDKINARATGPVQSVMRCPTEGRAKKGGVKIGTMEKDCLIANGATHVVLDRMCLSSSKYVTTVCKVCGIIETYNSTKNARCRACQMDGVMVSILIPYSFKVVAQELMALGICMRILTA